MERKIGEIFEFGGEWQQCVKGGDCNCCDLLENGMCVSDFSLNGSCFSCPREDKTSVIFKKLEKVGEPYMLEDKKFQKYKVFKTPYIYHKIDCSWQSFSDPYYISLEIKEDMEEKKLNLKPFNLEAAKAGKPVCTRDGHKARIICFDYNGETGDYPIVALVHYNKGDKCYERVLKYTSDGLFNKYRDCQYDDDLMMLPEKREGWMNVYKDLVYATKEEALAGRNGSRGYIDTIKISWEE